ncbi:uncharacterized protein ARMOST_14525 [Armillaria ostoyae]|uniref:Uncharacterized protein n=1 Tax=Armillaria ostoyae TaxID=47428 RepID=A0A284RQR8_ARMOS|nr:uncharacterized protein ARMOST_14525 [Armillaria ostoyae]
MSKHLQCEMLTIDRERPIRAGTKLTLIKNAKIWTGLHNGTQVPEADILIDKGLLIGVGSFGYSQLEAYGSSLEVVDAHVGYTNYASPELEGASAADGNFLKGTAQPWLRSLDGLNTHDDAYPLSIAVATTALILPGSANFIGVQAFDVSMLDGDNAPPEALPDIEDEGADELTSQSSQWAGNEVYKDVITNY